MKPITYKGYVAELEIDTEKGIIHGRVINTRDVITFSVKQAKNIMKEFEASVEDYLKACEEFGTEPNKPYNGRISYRTTPEHHALIERAAALRKAKSVNEFIDNVVIKAAEKITKNA